MRPHLLCLDCRRVLPRERQVRDRHILEHNVEHLRTLREHPPDILRHQLALRQQLRRIVLCDDALQRLLYDARQHTLVVVHAECAVDLLQAPGVGARERAEGDVDHLEVPAAGGAADGVGPRPDVINVGALEPGDDDVRAFCVGLQQARALWRPAANKLRVRNVLLRHVRGCARGRASARAPL